MRSPQALRAALPVRILTAILSRPSLPLLTPLLLATWFLVPGSLSAQDWGATATISNTLGVNGSRLCVGEASRGDLGCPTYAPSLTTAGDISVTGNLSAAKFIGDGSGLVNVGATSVTINTGASGSLVFRNEYGYLLSDASFSISSTTGSIGIGAGAPASLGTNGLYAAGSVRAANLITTAGLWLPTSATVYANSIPAININQTTGYMALLTSGTEALRIISSGWVGIGTSTPSSMLEVNGVIRTPNSLLLTNYGGLQISPTANAIELFVPNGSSKSLVFSTGNGEALRIVSTGFVGIGTSTPVALLTLAGNSASPVFVISRSTIGGSYQALSGGNFLQTLQNSGGTSIGSLVGNLTNANWGINTNTSSAPSTTLHVSGTLRIANGGESCDTDRLGAIRYAAGSFDICKNISNGWEPISTSTSSTTPAISTGLSGSIVFRDEYGYLKANNTFSISSTTGSIGIGAGAPSTVGNNGLYVQGGTYLDGSLTAARIGIFDGQYLQWGNGTDYASIRGHSGATNKYLTFSTSGTEALRIVSTGYVGIGTSTPSGVLDVSGDLVLGGKGSNNYVRFRRSSDGVVNSAIGFKAGAANEFQFMNSGGGGYFTWSTNDTAVSAERMRLNASGRLGISTSTPYTLLDVAGSIRIASEVSATLNTCDTNRLGALKYDSGAFYICQNTSNGWEAMATSGANSNNDRIISGTTQAIAYNNTSLSLVTAGTERMVIGTSGNVGIASQPATGVALYVSGDNVITGSVGIATATPSYTLDITPANNYVRIRRNDSFGELLLGNGTNTAGLFSPSFYGRVSGASRFSTVLSEISGTEDTGTTEVLRIGSRVSPSAFVTTRPNIAFTNNGRVDMLLAANGNFGIGITPTTKLEVAGTISATAFVGDGSALTGIAGGASSIDALTDAVSNVPSNTLFLGYGSGVSSSGEYNTAVGIRSMGSSTIGNFNTAVGWESLRSNTSGGSNVAVGRHTLYSNIGGSFNVAMGEQSLYSNTTGTYNTAIGTVSLYNNTTGARNLAFGYYAGFGLLSGSNNTFLGINAGSSITTGNNNLMLGNNAAPNSDTGSNQLSIANAIRGDIGSGNGRANKIGINVASPSTALEVSGTISATTLTVNGVSITGAGVTTFASLTDVSYSLAGSNIFGPGSLTGATANVTQSTAFGIGALNGASNAGYANTAFGAFALTANTTGNWNNAFGRSALNRNTTGGSNVAVGVNALGINTTGGSNVAVGHYALGSNITGSSNIAMGLNALTSVSNSFNNVGIGRASGGGINGGQNTFLGNFAGQLFAVGDTSQSNTLIGYNAGSNLTTGSSNMAIGANTGLFSATGSNQLNIANTIWGNIASGLSNANRIGINVASPTASLEVSGTISATTLTVNGVAITGAGASTFAALTDISFSTAGNNLFGPTSLVGANAGVTNSTAIGAYSLSGATNTGHSNSSFGAQTLTNNTMGNWNNAFGRSALNKNTSGMSNSAMGVNALLNNTTGGNNVAIGHNSLISNTTGGANISIGSYSLGGVSTSTENIGLGRYTGGNINGSRNIFIGSYAGQSFAVGDTSQSNTLIGYNAGGGITTGNNNLVLGANTSPFSNTGSNQLNLANALWGDIGSGMSNANKIGINVTSPTANFEVSGTISATVLMVNGVSITAQNTSSFACPAGFTLMQKNGQTIGCIQNTQNTAVTWPNANNACYNNYGGRLPSGAEWHNATYNYTLTDETGDWEWLSDTVGESAAYDNHAIAGNTAITDFSWSYDSTTAAYRCFIPATGNGSTSSITLAGLQDVAVTSPASGTVLTFNGGTSQWVALASGGGGGGASTLISLTDVSASAPASGTILTYNGTSGKWLALPGAAAGVSTFAALTDVSYSAVAANTFGPGTTPGSVTGVTSTNAFGFGSLSSASYAGSRNNAFGVYALRSTSSGQQNNAFGYASLYSNTTGRFNIAMGSTALYTNASGHSNIAMGAAALYYNSIGSYNIAIGEASLINNTADYNIAIGTNTLYYNTGGTNNVAVGTNAGFGVNPSTAFTGNSLFGNYAGRVLTTGNSNTIIGYNAGSGISTGSRNIVIGADTTPFSNTGSNQLGIANAIWGDIGSGINNANKIGINVTTPTTALEVSGTITGTKGSFTNTLYVGGDFTHMGDIYGTSDARLKTAITPLDNSLGLLAKLKPVSFQFRKTPGQTEFGFIAQDVQKLYPHLVQTGADPSHTLSLNYTGLIAPMVQGIQQVNSRTTVLESTVTQLQTENAELRAQLNAMQAEIRAIAKQRATNK